MAKKAVWVKCVLFICFISRPVHSEDLLVIDEEIELFLEYLVNLIKDALGYQQKINVYVTNNQSLNAMATQNGDIVINAGAIIQVDNFKELIAILAHEVGHLAGYHMSTFLAIRPDIIKSSIIASIIGAGAAIISKDPTPFAAGVYAGQALDMGQTLAKLRQKEAMADTKSAEAIIKLGWLSVFDGFVSLHRKLMAHGAVYNAYLSTHPQSQDRIDKFIEFLKEFKDAEITSKVASLLENMQKKFNVIQWKLKALIYEPSMILAQFKQPKDRVQRYARAMALMRADKYKEAIENVDEAIKQADDSVKPSPLKEISIPHCMEIKLMCLFNLHRYSELIKSFHVLQNKLRKNEVYRDITLIYALAVTNVNPGKQEIVKAIKAVKKIHARHPDDVSAIGLLGRLNNLDGQQDHASLYAAKAAVLRGDTEAAKLHAGRASSSKNPSVVRQAGDIISSVSDD
ncbi:MAG: M48 family metalloprotease [Holosporales bacterium]|jgi:predicted Zn-dependent protease|nr:M48 family metalloprotease [Holosporales bacterium]